MSQGELYSSSITLAAIGRFGKARRRAYMSPESMAKEDAAIFENVGEILTIKQIRHLQGLLRIWR